MKSIEFLQNIPKDLFVIKWSYALFLQVDWFRKPNDIDIYIKYENVDYFEFLSKKYNFTIGIYKNTMKYVNNFR